LSSAREVVANPPTYLLVSASPSMAASRAAAAATVAAAGGGAAVMDELDLRFLDTLEDIQEAYGVLDKAVQCVALAY